MAYDSWLVKADPDAGSGERIGRALKVARDPEAPRRALAREEFAAEAPEARVGSILVTEETPLSDDVTQDIDLIGAVLPDAAGSIELGELSPEQRQAGYDALDVRKRAAWNRDWRLAAEEWLGALDEWGLPNDGSRRWNFYVNAVPTVDGGRLLVCATSDEDFDGVPAWFEAIRFSLGEVADVAGYREASTFEVS